MAERPYELATTDDLIEELLLRYDHAAFTGMRCISHVEGSDKKGDYLLHRRFVGNSHTVQGLCLSLARQADKDRESRESDGPMDEEGPLDENTDEGVRL